MTNLDRFGVPGQNHKHQETEYMRVIELRSDTFSLPTPAMREAMYRADLGDDVYGEDPTVNRLQEMMADRVGQEEALLVPSGTMGNLVCLLTHCGRGDEVVLGKLSHIFLHEQGGSAALGGVHPHPVANNPDGTMDLGQIKAAIREEDIHCPRTQLVCLENSHNLCGGVAVTPAYTVSVCQLAHERGLAVHLDGERVFNAAIALGVDVRELTRDVDSLMVGLSKGLSCPVGSVICGSGEFIAQATRYRKILGGGMRQAGVIAAAGIVALEKMVDRLAQDHDNARHLAEGLNEIEGLSVSMGSVQTNLVYFRVTTDRLTPADLVAELWKKGVGIGLALGGLRAVTHYGIEESDVRAALVVFRQIMERR